MILILENIIVIELKAEQSHPRGRAPVMMSVRNREEEK